MPTRLHRRRVGNTFHDAILRVPPHNLEAYSPYILEGKIPSSAGIEDDLRNSRENSEVRTLARAQTLTPQRGQVAATTGELRMVARPRLFESARATPPQAAVHRTGFLG